MSTQKHDYLVLCDTDDTSITTRRYRHGHDIARYILPGNSPGEAAPGIILPWSSLLQYHHQNFTTTCEHRPSESNTRRSYSLLPSKYCIWQQPVWLDLSSINCHKCTKFHLY